MNSRRIPLANVPNAANSPLRPTSNILTKRSRTAGDDNVKDQPYILPPQKKHAAETVGPVQQDSRYPAYPARPDFQNLAQIAQPSRSHIPSRRGESLRDGSVPNQAARSASVASRATERTQHDTSLEDIRQWQRHYKKAFQEYVFYFESLPDDARLKLSRQIRLLGSKEEKFFSRSVTHIVTTKPIPPPPDRTNGAVAPNAVLYPSHAQAGSQKFQTINPTLLDNGSARARPEGNPQPHAPAQSNVHPDESRRQPASVSGDILVRARDMGIKIWALEKIQRMMVTMFETDTGEQPVVRYDRIAGPGLDQARTTRNTDLSQLLEKEKIQGVKDLNDMTFFRGYYVYVHDQDEKTRPIIVRDYQKPPTKEEGQWPQFRLTGPGRCPFVEDYYDRRAYRAAQETRPATTRSTTSTVTAGAAATASTINVPTPPAASVSTTVAHSAHMPSATLAPQKKRPAADEAGQAPAQRVRKLSKSQTVTPFQEPAPSPNPTAPSNISQSTNSMEPPAIPAEATALAISSRQSSAENLPPHRSHPAALRVPTRLIRGEPIASGIQPSNITSAIRSQMVSSAAGIGARGGTSKEVHQLQRKVLVQTTSASAGTGPSSFVNDLRTAASQVPREPPPRAAKLKAQESLCQKQRGAVAQPRKHQSKKKTEAEGKAGYCENCQDKFADFKVHVLSRKHRQFAMASENWKELDALLALLQRTSQT